VHIHDLVTYFCYYKPRYVFKPCVIFINSIARVLQEFYCKSLTFIFLIDVIKSKIKKTSFYNIVITCNRGLSETD